MDIYLQFNLRTYTFPCRVSPSLFSTSNHTQSSTTTPAAPAISSSWDLPQNTFPKGSTDRPAGEDRYIVWALRMQNASGYCGLRSMRQHETFMILCMANKTSYIYLTRRKSGTLLQNTRNSIIYCFLRPTHPMLTSLFLSPSPPPSSSRFSRAILRILSHGTTSSGHNIPRYQVHKPDTRRKALAGLSNRPLHLAVLERDARAAGKKWYRNCKCNEHDRSDWHQVVMSLSTKLIFLTTLSCLGALPLHRDSSPTPYQAKETPCTARVQYQALHPF